MFLRELIVIFFVIIISMSFGSLINNFINFISKDDKNLNTSTIFYVGLVLWALVCIMFEKIELGFDKFYLIPTICILITVTQIKTIYKLLIKEFNYVSLVHIFPFFTLFYMFYFFAFSKFPLTDIFQDIHYLKSLIEYGKTDVLNLQTANSYIPIFQPTFGTVYKIIPFDSIRLYWILPLIYGLFSINCVVIFFGRFTSSLKVRTLASILLFLTMPKTFISITNNNFLYFFIISLFSDLRNNRIKNFLIICCLSIPSLYIHRAVILLLPTFLLIFNYDFIVLKIKNLLNVNTVKRKYIYLFISTTIFHFILWLFIYIKKPSIYQEIVHTINSLIYFITFGKKDYIYEFKNMNLPDMYSFKIIIAEFVREYTISFTLIIILSALLFTQSRKKHSKNYFILCIFAFIFINLFAFIPIPNLNRSRLILNFILISLFLYMHLRLKNNYKIFILLATFANSTLLFYSYYSEQFNPYIWKFKTYYQFAYTLLFVLIITSIIFNKIKWSTYILLMVLSLEKILVINYFYKVSYGGDGLDWYPFYKENQIISHYSLDEYEISDKISSFLKTDNILVSDPKTLSIVKARLGNNSLFTYSNVYGGITQENENIIKRLLVNIIENKYNSNDLNIIASNPRLLSQEAFYHFKKKQINWNKENIEKKLVFVITSSTLSWAQPNISKDYSTYFPTQLKNLDLNLFNIKIIYQDQKVIVFSL